MSNINNWLSAVVNNDLHAYNKVNSRDLALCFNFIQIPDTNTIAITISIMKNKVKKNSLNPQSFAKIMNCIENSLTKSNYEYTSHTEEEDEHFINVKSKLSNTWYTQLCCHRIFFIPVDGLWSVVKNLFNQDNISMMKSNDITEVSVYVNTEDYDFNGKFY